MKWGFGGLVEFLKPSPIVAVNSDLERERCASRSSAPTDVPERGSCLSSTRASFVLGSAENRRITRSANAFVRYRNSGTSSFILQMTDCSSQAFVQRPKPRAGEFCGNEKLDVGPTNSACVELVAFEKLQAFFEGAGLRSGKQA